jgi:Tfp pilus assembly protein PilN
MISFDYLHAPRPDWVSRVLHVRIPPRLQGALIALMTASITVGGAWSIEHYRLLDARRAESGYRDSFLRSEHAVQQTKLLYSRVRTLINIDEQVRQIVASGNRSARTLADVANILPRHTWLTSIVPDDNGMVLEGRAQNLARVSVLLGRLAKAGKNADPVLLNAELVPDPLGHSKIKYVIRLPN